MTKHTDVQHGVIVEEEVELTLSELCRSCAVHAEVIISMVDEGILEPRGTVPTEWRFPGPALVRIERALRLQQDLDINLAGVALVVDLLDEIDTLRAQLRALERAHLK